MEHRRIPTRLSIIYCEAILSELRAQRGKLSNCPSEWWCPIDWLKTVTRLTAPVAAEAPTNDDDDPFLAAATAQAVAASLGLPTPMDHATAGASSSRRPAAGAGSPSKRLRANSAGDASPAPYAAIAGNHDSPLDVVFVLTAPP
jgi:hypothetical protein